MRLREFLTLQEVEQTQGDLDQEVSGLAYDSRQVARGEVFFAVPGETLDGHRFVAQALERGAAAVVVEHDAVWPAGTTWIRVGKVRAAMGLWSAHFHGRPSRRLKLVGITGTNGKTTTSFLVEAILAAAALDPGVIGTINYRFRGSETPSHHTTPESIDLHALLAAMARDGAKSAVLEVSSHALVQERVRAVDFDVGLFTNLSRDHLDYHKDMNDYFAAKSRLFTDYLPASAKPAKAAVIYGDDARGPELLEKARAAGLATWSYGRHGHWDVKPLQVRTSVGGLSGQIKVKGRVIDFSSALIGSANLENILGAVGVGFALGLPESAIVEGIAKLKNVPGRLEKIDNPLGGAVVVDYAHTPDALEKVLGAVRPLTSGRILTVFGCGGDRDPGKRPIMGEIAARLSDIVILTSDNPRSEDPQRIIHDIESGVRKIGIPRLETGSAAPPSRPGYGVEPDRREAIRLALAWAQPGDLILLAGKGHEDYQILGTQKIHFDDREIARELLTHEASR
ncbi:MAG TPA: UDP-N-acetylmuramoyl-L-alanyl-D-glutamate--2,6-diaminopimelate ligase [Verrucomicrobiae bacterium]|nr:UDP-N-acetylmuramoyl-L-alanyl-D-glutamate--2,6-diaminopimelate ligase [Verrucomicrobiae bacterium]